MPRSIKTLMNLSQWGIRTKLILLVLAVSLPLFALGISHEYDELRHAIRRAKASNLHNADMVSGEVDKLLLRGKAILATISEISEIKNQDWKRCNALFLRIKPIYPHYENIFVTDSKGWVHCSAIPQAGPTYAGDRSYFKGVMRTGEFTVGVAQVGRITKKPVVVIAYPVRDHSGRQIGMVGTAISLLKMQEIFKHLDPTHSTVINVIDHKGIIITSSTEPEPHVLKDISNEAWFKEIRKKGRGILELSYLDEQRLFAVSHPSMVRWYAVMSIPTGEVYTPFRKAFAFGLAYHLSIFILVLALARVLGNRIVKPVLKLVHGVKELGKGRLDSRVEVKTGDEIEELGDAFNQMASDLQIKTDALREGEERIRHEMEITENLLLIAGATADTTDMEKLMEEVLHSVSIIMGCDICLSYLWDKATESFRPNQASGLAPSMISLFRTVILQRTEDFIKRALETKEPVIEKPSMGYKSFDWIKNINAMAIIPLVEKKGCLGLIICIYTSPHEFTQRAKTVMHGISHQVSIALEAARSYRESMDLAIELAHKIETIQVISEMDRNILSTLKSDEVLEIAVRNIANIIPCERATVALAYEERQGFVYKAGFGISLPKGTFVPFTETSATEVVKTGRTQYVPDMKLQKDLLPLEKRFFEGGFLSHIRTSILAKGEIIGVLSVGSRRPASFSSEDLSILEQMASQIGIALENARLITDLEELFLSIIKSLSSAIDAKSPWTRGHSNRVTSYALLIGKELGLSEKEMKDLELAGLLHDIGKIGTYEAILDKPAKLTDEEMALMKEHPGKGAEILAPIKQLKDIIPAIRHHHENYDGTGYPDGLKEEEIPFHARILAVTDTFDAMKADRPYRKGRTMDFMIAEFKRCAGTQFDPEVAGIFVKALESGRVETP